MEEIWRDVPGYEGIYQVSSFGKVRSLDRHIEHKSINRQFVKGRMMKQVCRKGYLDVELSKNGVRKIRHVHRLVAIAFIDNPNHYDQVNHKDENKKNNHVDNLEWCDSKYNINYGSRTLKASVAKTNHPKRSKRVEQLNINNGSTIQSFPSINEAHRKTGIPATNISYCCRHTTRSAGGYRWKYAS